MHVMEERFDDPRIGHEALLQGPLVFPAAAAGPTGPVPAASRAAVFPAAAAVNDAESRSDSNSDEAERKSTFNVDHAGSSSRDQAGGLVGTQRSHRSRPVGYPTSGR